MYPTSFLRSYNIPHPHRLSIDACEDRLSAIEPRERQLHGRLRPCGKGTIGFKHLRRISKSDKQYECTQRKIRAIEYQDEDGAGNLLETSTRIQQETPLPLTLSKVSNGRKRESPKKRIAKGLTSHGRKSIEDGCFLLERKYGVRNLGFYTLTLSFEDPELISVFNDNAATCLKRFFEKINRKYYAQESSYPYIGVWELHPSRSARCQIPILHYHFVAPCYEKDKKRFNFTSSELRSAWTSCVENTLGTRLARACRVGSELCRKSASGYLSKYLSKSKDGNAGSELPEPPNLSSWFSVSRSLRMLIKKSTIPLSRVYPGASRESEPLGVLRLISNDFGSITKTVENREVCLGYWWLPSEEIRMWQLDTIDTILLD
jgi:hypothetical protein